LFRNKDNTEIYVRDIIVSKDDEEACVKPNADSQLSFAFNRCINNDPAYKTKDSMNNFSQCDEHHNL
jgi:hypothetical protein